MNDAQNRDRLYLEANRPPVDIGAAQTRINSLPKKMRPQPVITKNRNWGWGWQYSSAEALERSSAGHIRGLLS